MSSAVVRTVFRNALAAAFPAVLYVETISTRVDIAAGVALWQSLEFVGERDAAIGIGKPTCWRESGVVRVWAGAISGKGDAAAVAQLDAVVGVFRGFNSNGLRVLEVTPPLSASESDGRWLLASVDLRYQRDYQA